MPKQRGFTLIELMIVVAIIAVLAAIALPNLVRSRMAANESACVGSLRTVATQQAVFISQIDVDQDFDGVGEYGYFDELCGEVCVRKHVADQPAPPLPSNPPYLSPNFRTEGGGTTVKSGFIFRVYLPSNDNAGDAGGFGAMDDTESEGTMNAYHISPYDPTDATEQQVINLQERAFIAQAWPIEHRNTGQRCFCVRQIGEVYASKMMNITFSGYTNMGGRSMNDFALCFSQQPAAAHVWIRRLANGRNDPAIDSNIYNACGN